MTTPTAPAAPTSFPGFGSFFQSFPYQNLNDQFAASMMGGPNAPVGGMPGMGGAYWPSLFGSMPTPAGPPAMQPQPGAGGQQPPSYQPGLGGAGGYRTVMDGMQQPQQQQPAYGGQFGPAQTTGQFSPMSLNGPTTSPLLERFDAAYAQNPAFAYGEVSKLPGMNQALIQGSGGYQPGPNGQGDTYSTELRQNLGYYGNGNGQRGMMGFLGSGPNPTAGYTTNNAQVTDPAAFQKWLNMARSGLHTPWMFANVPAGIKVNPF